MKNNKLKITLAVIFWICTAAVMAMIFRFSCDTGEQSAQVSQGLLTIIIEHLGKIMSENFLRKMAHFTEFTALGFFTASGIYLTFDKRKFYIPLIPCVLYAISDEIHQYFVPERACRIFDVFVDSCGSSLGILIFLLISMLILKKHRTSHKK